MGLHARPPAADRDGRRWFVPHSPNELPVDCQVPLCVLPEGYSHRARIGIVFHPPIDVGTKRYLARPAERVFLRPSPFPPGGRGKCRVVSAAVGASPKGARPQSCFATPLRGSRSTTASECPMASPFGRDLGHISLSAAVAATRPITLTIVNRRAEERIVERRRVWRAARRLAGSDGATEACFRSTVRARQPLRPQAAVPGPRSRVELALNHHSS